MPLERFGPISGQAGDVAVTLTELSFRKTPTGGRYAYPDFGSDFIQALHEALGTPRRRGLLRSTLVCPWCGRDLDVNTSDRVRVAVEVALRRIPPVRVDAEMPGIRCGSCGRSVVRIDDRNVQSDLSNALIIAFEAVGFAP